MLMWDYSAASTTAAKLSCAAPCCPTTDTSPSRACANGPHSPASRPVRGMFVAFVSMRRFYPSQFIVLYGWVVCQCGLMNDRRVVS
jgi:hypothetical protein